MDVVAWTGVGVVGGLALSPELPGSAGVWACALVLALALARWRRGALPLAGVLLGALIGRSVPEGPVLRGPSAVQGVVAAAPMGRTADLSVWACADAGEPFRPCAGRVRVVFPEPPAPGSRWVVSGEGLKPAPFGMSGGPDPTRSAALARVRTVLRARSAAPLGGDPPDRPAITGPRGVLAAVATGDRRGVDESTWVILRDTGTAHLLAISGFHVGVVAGGVGGLVAFGLRRAALVRPGGVSLAWAWWAGALAALTYAWLAGAPISAQRAAGVAVLAAVGRSLGRSVDPMRLVAVAAVAVCAVDPSAIASPGFQLSFGAVLGLLRFGPVLDEPVRAALPRGFGWAAQGTVATIAATLGTLPAAAWWFQSLSLSSPLANLVAIPWMTVAIVPLAGGASFLPEPLAEPCGWLGGHAVTVLITVLGWMRTEPLAPAVGPGGALFLCVLFLRPRAGFVGAVLLVGLGLRTRSAGGLEVTFLDVGQGDAALVEHPDGRRWLVDGGRRDEVLRALRRRGVRTLDVVIASHGDADHAEGLLAVVQGLRVGMLVVGPTRDHDGLRAVARSRGVPVVVHPGLPGASANDGSVVVRASSPWGSVYFAGDLEAAGEAVHGWPSTVLKVPHHGSATSSSPGFLDRVAPELAVISVGPNRYGHPDPGVEMRLRGRGVDVLRTDLDGTVTVRFDPAGRWIHTERDGWRTLGPCGVTRSSTPTPTPSNGC